MSKHRPTLVHLCLVASEKVGHLNGNLCSCQHVMSYKKKSLFVSWVPSVLNLGKDMPCQWTLHVLRNAKCSNDDTCLLNGFIHCKKKRKCWFLSFSHLQTMFSKFFFLPAVGKLGLKNRYKKLVKILPTTGLSHDSQCCV